MIEYFHKIWSRYFSNIILIISAVLFAIGVINFIFIFDITSQSNDECLWVNEKGENDSTKIVFRFVKVDGVTWNAGIRDDDQMVAINGIYTKTTFEASRVFDVMSSGSYALYTIKRNGKVFNTNVYVKKLINIQGFAFNLLALLWLLVGFIVVMAKSDGTIQKLFFRIGLYAVLFAMFDILYRGATAVNPIFDYQTFVFVVSFFATLGGVFLPFALIKFFAFFPIEKKIFSKKWFKKLFIAVPIVIFIILYGLQLYLFFYKFDYFIYDRIANLIHLLIAVGMLISLVLLFFSYIKLKTKAERNSIFVILVAMLIGVISMIYTYFMANQIAGLIFNNPYYFTPIILVALLPIAFGYSIFRYSLMDVSLVVKNTLVYGTATVVLAGLYFLLMYVAGLGVSTAVGTEYKGIIAGAVFVIFAIAFQSTKDRFQEFLTEKFFPEQYAFEKGMINFSSEISKIVGKENIINSICSFFVDSLKIETYGLFVKNDSDTYELMCSQGISMNFHSINDPEKRIDDYFVKRIRVGKNAVLQKEDFDQVFGDWSKEISNQLVYTVIPMFIQNKVIGLLMFGLKQSGLRFSGKDFDLLIAAANQSAISIENARLYESETEKQKLERDLENARKIQSTLLPKVFPFVKSLDIAGVMIPAMHIGGDYFDLIKISDSKLFVVVGDVSGKGLSASFYMSKLQTMIRLYCTENKTPANILKEVNNKISEGFEKGWFISVVLALFDVEKNLVTFCRAGHTPIIRVRDNKIDSFQPAGIGLALDKGDLFDSTLEEISIELIKDDLFLFYSDGLTEQTNSAGDELGDERVKNFLIENSRKNASEIQSSMLDYFTNYRGKVVQYDDLTSVIIKYH